MATYRYYAADLLTGNVITELPLYSVSMERKLSAVGNLTGTIKLGSEQYQDDQLLSGTDPGRCSIYCERDDTLIWGGIVWTRNYSSADRTMQISASTFESYFDHVVFLANFVRESVGQLQIFVDAINQLQAQEKCNISLDVSQIDTAHASSIVRTVLIPGYEWRYGQDVVSQLVGVNGGFDYTIDVIPGAETDKPKKLVRVGYPLLGGDNTTLGLTFDYPGNIKSYTWPENGSSSGTRFVSIGAGSGSSMLSAEVRNNGLLNTGYPSWWVVQSNKDLGVLSEVTKAAEAARDKYSMPLNTPTFELKPDRIPTFDAWDALGANFTSYIEDARWPDGKSFVSRMLGWQLTPGGGDQPEALNFIVEGETVA